MPTRVWFGDGVTTQLSQQLDQYPACERILLVTGQGTLERAGLRAQLQTWCKGRTVVEARVAAMPDTNTVEAVRKQARKEGSQLVLGFGGGSVIDVAKAIAALVRRGEPLEELLAEARSMTGEHLPCMVIPTTAGTGSEVTPWSTIWNLRTKRKHSLGGPAVFADVAFVDPQWTHTMSPALTAATGLDALTHAIEACWSTRRNPVSTALAIDAIRLIIEALPVACAAPADREARTAMARGSLVAGLAFSQTQTAAAHAISYPLTARFGVPHGLACSISVPALLRLNGQAAPEAIAPILLALNAPSAEDAAGALSRFMDGLPIPRRLRDFNIARADLPMLAEEGLSPSRAANNPAAMDGAIVQRILEAVW